MNKQTLISVIVIAALVVAGLIILQQKSIKESGKPGQYNALATCLGEAGAKFYGAFWCPHCNNQKKAFGKSDELLPYIECSTPDGNAQTQVCIDNQIQSYPTWIFADGTRLTGEISLEELAKKTSCEATLPKDNTSETTIEGGASSEEPLS
ncbi:MAG: hypothetical protein QG654_551 [Patescibacteria group bacterium]|nr:hypothetical protein [Patescibacteria group bacterium]